MIEIKTRRGEVIFTSETAETVKDAVLEAISKNANLSNADLSNANLWNADLSNANLSNANLWNADLSNANLWNADLRYANLSNANLSNADLSNADLSNADLWNADLWNANLWNANLSNANLSNANLWNANLSNANLEKSKINFSSHRLLSEILFRAAGVHVEKRMIAGLIRISTDWCWDQFCAIEHPQKEWAFEVLRGWVQDGDNAPDFLREKKTEVSTEEAGTK